MEKLIAVVDACIRQRNVTYYGTWPPGSCYIPNEVNRSIADG